MGRTLVGIAALLSVVLAACVSSGATLGAASCRWRVELREGAGGLAVIGPQDVWIGQGGDPVSLAHWDGHRWTRFRVPSAKWGGRIDDVEASSPDEVWAVGRNGGAARWRNGRIDVVPTPLRESLFSSLSSTAPDDVWAAGMRTPNQKGHPLIEHWDGRRWTVSFTEDAYGAISDVLALSRRDVWATGYRRVSPIGSRTLEHPFVMHWDGKRWRHVRGPGRPAAYLGSLSGTPGTIWATAGVRQHRFAFARWDGRRWTFALGPPVKRGLFRPAMYDLALVSPTDVWAVGRGESDGIMVHWDGTTWLQAQAPRVHHWESVDAAAGELWAIGWPGVIARCTR